MYVFKISQSIENKKACIKMIKDNYYASQNQTGLITGVSVQGLKIQETIGKYE